ncbi:MAG: HEPN domain-containing protein [Muribaculaceae bacterium]|nr:HEPN domain-containing protein [Muribaculaceae bacterium]
MTLNKEEKDAIIAYRIEKSQMAMKEAVDNSQLKNWSLTANRLYYAAFYMALAINLSNGDISKTHNGTYNLFSKKYIAPGILSREEGSLYRRLFTMRQSGDYDDLFDWEEEDVLPLIPKVAELLDKMKSLLLLDE